MTDDNNSETFFGSDPSDVLGAQNLEARLDTEEQTADGEESGGEESSDGQSLSDLGLVKGLSLYAKYLMGKDIGEYEALLSDASGEFMAEQHKDLIAPSAADFEDPTHAKVGSDYVKSAFTSHFPNEPNDLFLREVFGRPDLASDVAIHLSPYDDKEAIRFLKRQVENLQAEFQTEGNKIGGSTKQRRFQAAQNMLSRVQNTPTTLYDAAMYGTVRGDSLDEVQNSYSRFKRKLERAPALTEQVVGTYVQDKTFQTTSPIGLDDVGYDRQMLSGAVGAMLPMSSTTVIEDGGVTFGLHGYNGSPIIVNRFERDGGFNQLTVGSIGSGKSFSSKLQILRSYAANRDDLVVVAMDPLASFTGFTESLGGERIRVGGSKGINPMEIHPPVLEEGQTLDDLRDEGVDPFKETLDTVSSFFGSFFEQEDIELGSKKPTLEAAIQETYHNAGITKDPSTHDKPSPTIAEPDSPATLLGTLEDMVNNTEDYAREEITEDLDGVESPTDIMRRHASQLLSDLRAFRPGSKYDMIGGHTDIDVMDEDFVLLDMQANEMDDDQGLMMSLLFNAVYEKAKSTDKKVLFTIDESHVMMQDENTLDMLERAVRHSRHYNLSINFITQQTEDFFKEEQAKTIADNCTIKVILQVDDIGDRAAQGLGLNDTQRKQVRNLKTGKSNSGTILGVSYSEALLYLDTTGWIPMQVVPSLPEIEIVDIEGEAIRDKRRFIDTIAQLDRTR